MQLSRRVLLDHLSDTNRNSALTIRRLTIVQCLFSEVMSRLFVCVLYQWATHCALSQRFLLRQSTTATSSRLLTTLTSPAYYRNGSPQQLYLFFHLSPNIYPNSCHTLAPLRSCHWQQVMPRVSGMRAT